VLDAVVERDDLPIVEEPVGKNDGAVEESEHGMFVKVYPIGAKPATVLFRKSFVDGKPRRVEGWGVWGNSSGRAKVANPQSRNRILEEQPSMSMRVPEPNARRRKVQRFER